MAVNIESEAKAHKAYRHRRRSLDNGSSVNHALNLHNKLAKIPITCIGMNGMVLPNSKHIDVDRGIHPTLAKDKESKYLIGATNHPDRFHSEGRCDVDGLLLVNTSIPKIDKDIHVLGE